MILLEQKIRKRYIRQNKKRNSSFSIVMDCYWAELSGLGECYDWGWPWPLGSWLSLPPSSWAKMTLNTTTLGTHIRITSIWSSCVFQNRHRGWTWECPEKVFSCSLIHQVKIFAEYLVRIDEMCLIMILTAWLWKVFEYILHRHCMQGVRLQYWY